MILDSLSYRCSTSEHVPKMSNVHLFQRCHTFPAAFSHTRSWHVVSVHAHQSSINRIKEQLTKLNDSYDQKCCIFLSVDGKLHLTVPGIHMKITTKTLLYSEWTAGFLMSSIYFYFLISIWAKQTCIIF